MNIVDVFLNNKVKSCEECAVKPTISLRPSLKNPNLIFMKIECPSCWKVRFDYIRLTLPVEEQISELIEDWNDWKSELK